MRCGIYERDLPNLWSIRILATTLLRGEIAAGSGFKMIFKRDF